MIRSVRTRPWPPLSVRSCHTPDTFRPCRSSRLRRLSPLERCRLVPSCSRPWGWPRFRPVPSSRGGGGSDIRRCLLPVLPGWSAASACFRLFSSEDDPCGAARWPGHSRGFIPFEGFPSCAAVSGGPAVELPVCLSETPAFSGACLTERSLALSLVSGSFPLAVGLATSPWLSGRCFARPEGVASPRLASRFPSPASASGP